MWKAFTGKFGNNNNDDGKSLSTVDGATLAEEQYLSEDEAPGVPSDERERLVAAPVPVYDGRSININGLHFNKVQLLDLLREYRYQRKIFEIENDGLTSLINILDPSAPAEDVGSASESKDPAILLRELGEEPQFMQFLGRQILKNVDEANKSSFLKRYNNFAERHHPLISVAANIQMIVLGALAVWAFADFNTEDVKNLSPAYQMGWLTWGTFDSIQAVKWGTIWANAFFIGSIGLGLITRLLYTLPQDAERFNTKYPGTISNLYAATILLCVLGAPIANIYIFALGYLSQVGTDIPEWKQFLSIISSYMQTITASAAVVGFILLGTFLYVMSQFLKMKDPGLSNIFEVKRTSPLKDLLEGKKVDNPNYELLMIALASGQENLGAFIDSLPNVTLRTRSSVWINFLSTAVPASLAVSAPGILGVYKSQENYGAMLYGITGLLGLILTVLIYAWKAANKVPENEAIPNWVKNLGKAFAVSVILSFLNTWEGSLTLTVVKWALPVIATQIASTIVSMSTAVANNLIGGEAVKDLALSSIGLYIERIAAAPVSEPSPSATAAITVDADATATEATDSTVITIERGAAPPPPPPLTALEIRMVRKAIADAAAVGAPPLLALSIRPGKS